jgi:hypothetical protein
MGISRRTYERRKARETQSVASACTPMIGGKLLYTDLRQIESHESQPWLQLGISRSTYYRRQRLERLAAVA